MSNGIVSHDEIPPCPIDDSGKFTKQVHDFAGLNVKVCTPVLYQIVRLTEVGCRRTYPKSVKSKGSFDRPVYCQPQLPILLAVRDFRLEDFFSKKKWDRSGTPLIYRAIPSWFVKVTPIVDQLVANNEQTRWFVHFCYQEHPPF